MKKVHLIAGKRTLSLLLLGLFTQQTMAEENMLVENRPMENRPMENRVVEWAPFVKVINIKDRTLIEAANQVNRDFISLQPGFIKRELVKKNEIEYADILYWKDRKSAELAGKKVYDCQVCLRYFEMMDENVKTGGEFAHYQILKTWSVED